MNIEKLIKENVKLLDCSLCKVFISPEIPEKKLNNAIASMAPEVDPNYVLAIIDTTLLGSAKEGLLFVGDRVYINHLERSGYLFEKMKSIEKREHIETDSTGAEKTKVKYILRYLEEEVDITSAISSVNQEGFIQLVNTIVSEIDGNDGTLEITNQTCPLAMMNSEIKETYLKLICNYAYSDDGIIDSKEYAEIMSLIALNSIEKDVRISIRSYMYEGATKVQNAELIAFLNSNVDSGSLDALKLSVVKDTINLYWSKMSSNHNVEEWKQCDYIVELAKSLKVEDEQVNYIVENIKKNKEIIENRQDDIQIKKNMQELVAKAGAVGVPLAAIYLSGSVIGVSAAGMTSGLAALGMGGVLGFSSMFTGIGVAVLLGVGAYKGVKIVTGMGDLEKNKQREMMLQEIAKNSQKALNYLIEDVNEVTFRLQEAIVKGQENEIKIQKLAGILAMMSKGAQQTTEQIDFAEKEKLICRLPGRIKKEVIEELAVGATKAPIREIIYAAYTNSRVDEEGNTVSCCLNTELSLLELENVYNSLEGIGFYNMANNTKAQAVNAAKGIMKGLLG